MAVPGLLAILAMAGCSTVVDDDVHACPEPDEECAWPYMIPNNWPAQQAEGACLWHCAAGTEPDEASGECVCRPGLVESSWPDEYNRRFCVDPGACLEQCCLQETHGEDEVCAERRAAGQASGACRKECPHG